MIMVQWNRSTSAYGNKIPVLPSFHHSKHFGQYHKKTFSVDLLSRFGLLYSVCKSFFKACYKILCRVSMKTGHGLQASCQCHSRVFIRGFHSFLMLFLTTAITYKDTELHRAVVNGENWFFGTLFYLLVTASIVLYYAACLTNPGFIPVTKRRNLSSDEDDEEEYGTSERHEMLPQQQQQQQHFGDDEVGDSAGSDPENPTAIKLRTCGFCGIQQPLRARHCEDCGHCVRRFDHHCPWLGTCVGEGNHRWFWAFLVVTSIIAVWAFLVVIRSFEPEVRWSDWLSENGLLLVVTVILVLGGLPAIALSLMHSYVMVFNITTWEAVSKERITYLRDLEFDINPFHQGYLCNAWRFLCLCTHQNWERLYTNSILKIDKRYRR